MPTNMSRRGGDESGAWTGGCLCGAVRYGLRGPFGVLEHCHCTDCRRAHAAAFATFVDVPVEALAWTGGDGLLRSFAVGTGAIRTFCSVCGSLLTWRREGAERICVTAATIDQPLPPLPGRHIFVRSRVPWFTWDDDLPKHMEGA